MTTQPRGRGFWRGFLTGLILAALGLVGLAMAFPPLQPPEVSEGSLQPPAAPGQPRGMAGQTPGGLLPSPAEAPLVPGLPDAAAPKADAPPAGTGSPAPWLEEPEN